MAVILVTISSHPLVAPFIVSVLSSDPELRPMVSQHPLDVQGALPEHFQPSLFIVDMFACPLDPSQLFRLLRARCDSSKFLALTLPQKSTDDEILRLLYLDVDGFVNLTHPIRDELLEAVKAILKGAFWAPPHLIRRYVRTTNIILRKQMPHQSDLTAREQETLGLMSRRLSNKEIANVLNISERTVKFHVSNIFSKLGISNRRAAIEERKVSLGPKDILPHTIS